MRWNGRMDGSTHLLGVAAASVHDPVCGMPVDPVKAAYRTLQGGVNYFFCWPGAGPKRLRILN